MNPATLDLYQRYVIPNYTRYPVCLVRGEGSHVWDDEGNRYLDFFPGWGCNLLGHCPPRVVAAVREQVGRLIHVPNTWYTEAAGETGPGARRAHRLGRPVLLLQQRRGGQRGGHQGRPPQRQAGPLQDRHHAQQLPRPDLRRPQRHRPAEIPSGPGAAAGRLQLRPVRRPRRRGQSSSTPKRAPFSSSRSRARAESTCRRPATSKGCASWPTATS